MRRKFLAGATMLLVLLAMTGCGGGEGPGSQATGGANDATAGAEGEDPAETSGQGYDANEIRVGAHVPLSGPAADAGELYVQGLELAFDQINNNGGINGRNLRLITGDDKYEPAQAVSIARRLVTSDDVIAVTSIGTPNTVAASKYLNEEGVLQLFPLQGAVEMVEPPKKYTFVASPEYVTQGYLVTRWVIENHDVTKIGVIYQDDDVGNTNLEGVRKAIDEVEGAELVAEEALERGSVDVSAQVAAVRDAGADAVFHGTALNEAALIAKETAKIGYDPIQFSYTSQANEQLSELAGAEAVDGYIAENILEDFGSTPEMNEMEEAFREEYGEESINFFTSYGYMAATLMADAFSEAGEDLSTSNIITVLEGWDEHETGMSGPITYGPDDRNGLTSVRIVQLKDGKFEPASDFIRVADYE